VLRNGSGRGRAVQGPGGRSAGGARVQGAGGRSPGRGWGAAAGRAATPAVGRGACWVGRGRRAAGSPGAPGHKIEDREVRNWTRVSRWAESKSAESRHGALRDLVAPKHVARLRLATSSAASRV